MIWRLIKYRIILSCYIFNIFMISNASAFYSLLKSKFPFAPTSKQDMVLMQLSQFIFDANKDSIYLLKGYAGTGKTSIIGTIVYGKQKKVLFYSHQRVEQQK